MLQEGRGTETQLCVHLHTHALLFLESWAVGYIAHATREGVQAPGPSLPWAAFLPAGGEVPARPRVPRMLASLRERTLRHQAGLLVTALSARAALVSLA